MSRNQLNPRRREALRGREVSPVASISADLEAVKVRYDRTIRPNWSEPGQDAFNSSTKSPTYARARTFSTTAIKPFSAWSKRGRSEAHTCGSHLFINGVLRASAAATSIPLGAQSG